MKYDTPMPSGNLMKVHQLPEGDLFQDAQEAGWDGNMLHLVLPDGLAGFSPGALVEIESESMLYLGEVRQRSGSAMDVLVEHSLDRARLSAMRDTWG
jgi:hypothetical protein